MLPLYVQDMIEEVDLDASGTISIEEFYSMMGAKPDLPDLPDSEDQIEYPEEETMRCGFQVSNWALGVLGPENCFRKGCQVHGHTITAVSLSLLSCYDCCCYSVLLTWLLTCYVTDVIVLSH